MGKWITIIGKFEADSSTNLTAWRDIIHEARALGPDCPVGLSSEKIWTLTQSFTTPTRAQEAWNLWQACGLRLLEPSDGGILAISDTSKKSEELIGELQWREFEATDVAKSFESHTTNLNQGNDFSTLCAAWNFALFGIRTFRARAYRDFRKQGKPRRS